MTRAAEGFARTVKGFECWLDPELAAAIRRSAREVQELIASEPAVEGLAAVGPEEESVEDTELGAFTELQGMLAAGTLAGLAGLGGEVPPLSDDPALARLFPVAYADPERPRSTAASPTPSCTASRSPRSSSWPGSSPSMAPRHRARRGVGAGLAAPPSTTSGW